MSDRSTLSAGLGAGDTVARLQEERDFLLESLRDLERERAAGDIDEGDYTTLHDDYTARAAAVLRAIRRQESLRAPNRRRGRPESAPVVDSGPGGRVGAGGRTPWTRRRAVVTAGSVLLMVVLASVTLANVAGTRQPGQSVTGSVAVGTQGRLEEALRLETGGKAADALKLYDAILRDEPDNVAALSYRGWLLKRAGLPDQAMASLDRAVVADPSFPDAHFFRGMVLYQDRNDPAAAVPEFRLFLSNRPPPEMVPMVQGVLDRAMSDIQATPAPTTTAVSSQD